MAEERGRPERSTRWLFAVLGAAFLAVSAWAVFDEVVVRRPWKVWQEAYRDQTGGGDVRIEQVVVPALNAVDRCPTCHAGVDDPRMEGAEVPLGTHTRRDTLLRHHPVERFGCTSCHRGQGLALTAGTAHGEDDPHWPDPMLRGAYTEATCLGCHPGEEALDGAPRLSLGRRAFRELGCGGCHATGFDAPKKRGPSLKRIATKLHPGALLSWIREPKPRRRGFKMPQFWPGAEHDAILSANKARESLALAAYLLASSEPMVVTPPDPAQAEAGAKLFDRVGCRGCHVLGGEGEDAVSIREEVAAAASDDAWASFDDSEPEPKAPPKVLAPIDFAPPLGKEAERATPGFLAAWVKDPAAYWPGATMPTLRLSAAQAGALAAFLAARGTPPPPVPELAGRIDKALVAEGRALVGRYGCFGCHDVPGFDDEGRPGPELNEFGVKSTEDMDFGPTLVPTDERTWERFAEGKVRHPRAFERPKIVLSMPEFALDDATVEGLLVYLRGLRGEALPSEYVHAAPPSAAAVIEARNCRGCHAFDKTGSDIGRYYESPYLGPPTLEGEGAKVQPQWLFGFLLAPRALRPWLEVRMPSFRFTEEEALDLTADLARRAGKAPGLRPLAVRPITPARAAVGADLFLKLKCVQCHLLRNEEKVETAKLAADLGLARERLDPLWVRRWLEDPGKILPGTKMPQFFPEGQTPLKTVLGGSAAAQMDLLVEHLMNLGLQPAGAP